MISPSDLRYFMEVADTENLSRAAERIGISQPSLSLAIRRIEETLGTDILIRSKKGVNLTKSGLMLLKNSKSLLQHWNSVKNEALDSMNEVTGNISLGCHPSVGLYTLEKFIPKLLLEFPSLEFSLKHDLSRNITEQVISLKIDIALVINPVRHPDLVIKKLIEDTVTLWTSGVNEDVLICDPELLQTQTLLKKLRKKGINFTRVITSSSLDNITTLCASGAGVGIIPSRVAKKLGQKRITQFKGAPIFKDELCLAYIVENKKVRAIQEVVKEITTRIN